MSEVAPAEPEHAPSEAGPPPASVGRPVTVAFVGVAAIFATIGLSVLVRSPRSIDALDPAKAKRAEADVEEPVAAPHSAPRVASGPSAAPHAAPPRTAGVPPPATGAPAPPAIEVSSVLPSADAKAIIERLDTHFLRNQLREAIGDIEELAKLDVTLFRDRKVRDRVIDLAQRVMFSKGDEPQKLFGVIANQLGANGPDILYEMVTTKGGTRAADLARSLLLLPEVQQRASAALKVAWELREAPCEQKPALFDRAAKDGDARAYQELAALKWCRKTSCCVKAPELDTTLATIRGRMK